MSLQLPLDIQQLVNVQLATGEYASVDDVLREALLSLAERQAVNEDLQKSLADIEAGRMAPLEDIVVEIRRRHGWASQ